MVLSGFKSSFLPFHEKQAYLRHASAELARYDDEGRLHTDSPSPISHGNGSSVHTSAGSAR
jgi:adenosine deaminase